MTTTDPLSEPPSAAEPEETGPPAFTCPRCGRVSHHPTDLAEGYCGACHDWTGVPVTKGLTMDKRVLPWMKGWKP
jgi:hypothetical protein